MTECGHTQERACAHMYMHAEWEQRHSVHQILHEFLNKLWKEVETSVPYTMQTLF